MILVTGGAGYIGSHMVLALDEAGYDVVVVDNLSRGHRDAVAPERLIELDLRDRDGLAGLFRKHDIEGVFHFAALAYVGESVVDPKEYYQVNIIGGLNLFGLAAERRIPTILSSTCAVYGEPAKLPLTEDHPRRPINPYGFSKYVLEKALDDYGRAYGLPWMALRYFNAAGADPQGRAGERHDPETHLIPLVLEAAAGLREAITVFGEDYPTPDGTCIRDYIHVSDLAAAHLAALTYLNGGGPGRAINLGLGRGFSVREVIDVCALTAGRRPKIIAAGRRPGDPAELIADPSLARSILNFTPLHEDLADIIATAWNWMQARR